MSVSRSSMYGILRSHPEIRLLKVVGSKRAIPIEDIEKFARSCAVVGVGRSGGKMRSVEAAARASRVKKLAKISKAAKPPAMPAPIAAPAPNAATPAVPDLDATL